MRDLLIEIWSSVRKNRLRTVLTGFAVAWGIFMLIVLLGAGNGLLNAIKSNASNFIANSMMAQHPFLTMVLRREDESGLTAKTLKPLQENNSIII